MAEIAYDVNLNANVPEPSRQELTAGVTTRTVTRGGRGRPPSTQPRSLNAGIQCALVPETRVAVGIELPVTQAREFDYVLRARFIREF
ncbi:MAG: hypothetical protein DMD89_36865 [Candidatus Rokuibacteriota bacterium]|nr:MAG: hypothetical protein DMD89_36865 [Candidatus Rokubacteria bacterium]